MLEAAIDESAIDEASITRIAVAGLPQWYKEDYLVKKQFEVEDGTGSQT